MYFLYTDDLYVSFFLIMKEIDIFCLIYCLCQSGCMKSVFVSLVEYFCYIFNIWRENKWFDLEKLVVTICCCLHITLYMQCI